jgi:LPS-assembly lipoprotein
VAFARRAFGCAAIAGILSSCGFRPVYGPSRSGGPGPAQSELAAVSVALIPERAGQLLRQALQERLERGGLVAAPHYDLVVAYGVAVEAIAIQPDTSSSRTRVIGTATWKLMAQDPQHATLASGVVRHVDGFNIFNEQYFAADLESETVQRRMAEAVADQITMRLAAYFDRQSEKG